MEKRSEVLAFLLFLGIIIFAICNNQPAKDYAASYTENGGISFDLNSCVFDRELVIIPTNGIRQSDTQKVLDSFKKAKVESLKGEEIEITHYIVYPNKKGAPIKFISLFFKQVETKTQLEYLQQKKRPGD